MARSKSKKKEGTHPTYARLIDSATELLSIYSLSQITTDMILEHSGVSRGSLYHHFEDLNDLLMRSLTASFSDIVEQNINTIETLIEKTQSPSDFIKGAQIFNKISQSPDRRGLRLDRLRMISLSMENEKFSDILKKEQDRLTSGYKILFEKAQANKWISTDIDPHAAAVFIQAYTFGRVIDDISGQKVDPAAWEGLLMKVVERVLTAP